MIDQIVNISLPTHRELPARHRPLRAIYVSQGGDALRAQRTAQMVIEGPDAFLFQFPDDWLCVDDLQAICDVVAIRTGRPIIALTVNHAMRRAIIVLINEHTDDGLTTVVPTPGGNLHVCGVAAYPDLAVLVERDLPSRLIRVTVAPKEPK